MSDSTIRASIPKVTLPAGEEPLQFLRAHEGSFDAQLYAHGAILFSGFGADTVERFDEICRLLSPNRPMFKEESSPRSQIAGAVYTSTDYPANYPIQFHNEYSYSSEWPLKIYFGCLVRPGSGGATPIADTRRILGRLRPSTRERFREKKVLYVRNFSPYMGVKWQTAFGTSDRAEVEAYCETVGIEPEWRSGDGLTTRQIGDAIVRHPRTNEEVWFNHAFFFNVRGIEPESLRETLLSEPEEELSTNTYYGDGTPIEPEVIEEIREAYEKERLRFDWEVGDVFLIDNMLVSHAREPFSPPRKIVVTMADPFVRADLR